MSERALVWMPRALMCALLAGVAARATRPIRDPDDWWHLRLGNELIQRQSLSAPPHWSVFASVPWVPTEPLPEIVSAYVDRWAGLPGLAVLFGLAGLTVVLAIYLCCRKHAGPLASTVATGATVLAISASFSSRPQLVSFVLLPVVVVAWLRTERDHRVRWWLVPTCWFWSLCHGFWVIGVGYGFVFVAGFALSRCMPWRIWVRHAGVALASVAVVLLNPVGVGVLEAPFAVNSTSKYILEWERTDLLSGAAVAALLMAAVTVTTWLRTRDVATWPRVLALLSALFWIWYAARTIAVGGVVLAPLLAEAFDRLVRGAGGPHERPPSARPPRAELAVLGAAAALGTLFVATLAPTTADRPGNVPTVLDGALDRLPAGTRIFNDYALGGWIVWRHPDLEQFIDGLITPYTPRHVHDYVVAESGQTGWAHIIRASHVRAALLRSDAPLVALLEERGWTSEATGQGYVLLVPAPHRTG